MGQRLKGTTAFKNYQDLKKDFGKIPTKKKEISSYGYNTETLKGKTVLDPKKKQQPPTRARQTPKRQKQKLIPKIKRFCYC